MKKLERKLALKKLTISKLNNASSIQGGSAGSIAGLSDGSCVTKISKTCDDSIIFCPNSHQLC